MKNTPGIVAILLPWINHAGHDLLPQSPLRIGATLLPDMITLLTEAASLRMPLALLKNKKLVFDLHLEVGGTRIIAFKQLRALRKLPVDMVCLSILSASPGGIRFFMLNDQSLSVSGLSVHNAATFKPLFAFAGRPHMLCISQEGHIYKIIKGLYVNEQNINTLTGGDKKNSTLITPIQKTYCQ